MKKLTYISRVIAATALSAMPILAAMAGDGVEISHLGVNNTLVRVTGDADYLILPVEEAREDARINVLVDGKVAETIYVRLAGSKTDFTVPFDLTPYKGKNVVLDIVTPQGRESVREASADVCWNGITLSDSIDTSDRETKYRPLFHHSPLNGWMNDPNGMFYKDGKWHLYYQRNPYGSKWQNMTWGHSVSSDLINWEHLPDAIRPDGLGSIFSGSCVIDHNNTAGYGNDAVIALYTSAGTSQMQSMAASNDGGSTFEVFGGNPVLTLESEARDPNMFWNDETGEWNLTLAHALDHEMLFFTSPDLKSWTLQSAFGIADEEFENISYIKEFEKEDGSKSAVSVPTGLFVTDEGHIYICEQAKGEIIEFDENGKYVRTIGDPNCIGLTTTYAPRRLVVDTVGRIYVLVQNCYEGFVELTPQGEFNRYVGATEVSYSMADLFWRNLQTEEQRARSALWLPTSSNIYGLRLRKLSV